MTERGDGREWLAAQPLPPAAREQVTVALAMIDAIEAQIAPLDRELRAYARRQAGCKALMGHDGIGELVAVTILAELGDCTRFSSSRNAIRYVGMDITVYQSDQHRAPGHLSRQADRAADGRCSRPLSQRADGAARTATTTARRSSGSVTPVRAWLAQKLLKRSYHTLRELGEEALQPA